VVKTFPNWRLIEDPDGTKGWMLVSLLSDRRTALIKAGEPRAIRTAPEADAKVRYRAQPGVVGQIDKCGSGWCRIKIGKRSGYVSSGDIHGLDAGETVN
ncbi:MAG: SH3 domain-containing protein, partial [Sphingomicrobium sp.]